jgi:hypothetical protein
MSFEVSFSSSLFETSFLWDFLRDSVIEGAVMLGFYIFLLYSNHKSRGNTIVIEFAFLVVSSFDEGGSFLILFHKKSHLLDWNHFLMMTLTEKDPSSSLDIILPLLHHL